MVDANQPLLSESASKRGRTTSNFPDLASTDPKLKYVKKGYFGLEWVSMILYVLIPFLIGLSARTVSEFHLEDIMAVRFIFQTHVITLLIILAVLTALLVAFLVRRSVPIYLLDFSLYTPPEELAIAPDEFLTFSGLSGFFDGDALKFQERIVQNNGLGPDTYLPRGVLQVPPSCTMENARLEAEEVMFSCLDDLFQRTSISPKMIDILIINCSLFNPTPSLTAMVVNHYKMRSNILTYNLSGMGCSASGISVDLAKDLLQVHRGKYAIVISTENITQNWYFGSEKSMLIPNTLFRMGGAAILLTNRWQESYRAKYRLLYTVRTHKGSNDACYQSVFQLEDHKGYRGVRLSKEIMQISGDALKTNITTLGPLVLPLSEQIHFFVNLCLRKVLKRKLQPYVPNFKKAFQHFCIHAGGRGVIDALEKNLSLSEYLCEPSRATLWRWGNTSSSSIWYEMLYLETHERVKRGDRIWQIAFGSGFKCNSLVWRALRKCSRDASEWPGEIHSKYPNVNRYTSIPYPFDPATGPIPIIPLSSAVDMGGMTGRKSSIHDGNTASLSTDARKDIDSFVVHNIGERRLAHS
mmetsp:Transcript_24890/g.40981  ORF Transcript_24890/g.40981 Transcript_24890/m.40981 type:complete len:581 (+) Transcript_24890:205-1947(+)